MYLCVCMGVYMCVLTFVYMGKYYYDYHKLSLLDLDACLCDHKNTTNLED